MVKCDKKAVGILTAVQNDLSRPHIPHGIYTLFLMGKLKKIRR